jgi:hypothetical protein
MAFLRFLVLSVVSLCLVVLLACGAQQNATTPNPNNTSAASSGGAMNHAGMSHGKKININNAILSELDKLEAKLGIPALSNKIQASRPYGKPEELVSKNVITQPQYDQIKDLVTIEEIVLTGEAKDLDYMVKLGLMKGHMYVAKELLDLGKPEQAEPHIGHPVEEIYADVEDQFNERGVADFKGLLIGLQDMVKAGAKNKTKVEQDFAASMNAIDGAIAKLPESQRKSPKFVLQSMAGLLETAKDEYDAAIADGKVKEAIEYQDSRGFVRYASELYQSVSANLNPTAAGKMTKTLADLATAWPEPLPPQAPVKTPEQVAGLVKEVELAAQTAQS